MKSKQWKSKQQMGAILLSLREFISAVQAQEVYHISPKDNKNIGLA